MRQFFCRREFANCGISTLGEKRALFIVSATYREACHSEERGIWSGPALDSSFLGMTSPRALIKSYFGRNDEQSRKEPIIERPWKLVAEGGFDEGA